MSYKDIIKKVANLPAGPSDIPVVPAPETIGFFVRWERDLRQWKKSTLADFAGVSISTIERVERGEKVSDEVLDRIADGLGREPGYFTAPRFRLGPEQAAARLVERFRETEAVACCSDEHTSSGTRNSELSCAFHAPARRARNV